MPTNLSTFLQSTYQGSIGIQGFTGSQGTFGTQGITGSGSQGIEGSQGTTGSQGITGTQGIQGFAATDMRTLNFVIDGGGVAITPGVKGNVVFDRAFTITGWTVLADIPGSIVIDVRKGPFGAFPLNTTADHGASIAGTELPTLSGIRRARNLNLTTWTTAIAFQDVLEFEVNSASTVTRVVLVLSLQPT
jgi:hypothetical protein